MGRRTNAGPCCRGSWRIGSVAVGSWRWEFRPSAAVPERGRVGAILRSSGGWSGLRGAARRAVASAKADSPYGGCSSGVERWTVAPEAAGSKPVIHPSIFFGRPLTAGRLPPFGRAACYSRRWARRGVRTRAACHPVAPTPSTHPVRRGRSGVDGSPLSAERCSTEALSLGWHSALGCVLAIPAESPE